MADNDWDTRKKREIRFQYVGASNTEERIEAIYDELRSTGKTAAFIGFVSLKDHLIATLDELRKLRKERQEEREQESYNEAFALGVLAAISLVLLSNGFIGQGDITWIDEHRFGLRLWGMAFTAVYIGVCIERSSLFRRLWAFSFTKVVFSLVISALVIFSTGQASSLINNIFTVDPAAFPFTRAYLTSVLAVKYAAPVFTIIAVFAIIHLIVVASFIKSKKDDDPEYQPVPWHSFFFLVLAVTFLGISWGWLSNDFSEKALPAKVYRLAHVLDFNGRHPCVNIRQGVRVVFLGSEHTKVLVDTGNPETTDIESFVNRDISDRVTIPDKFFFMSCQLEAPNHSNGGT